VPNITSRTPEIAQLNFTTDLGAGARARIGLLVLESDQTMEWEMRQMADLPGVTLYHARLANNVEVTLDTLMQMELEIPKAAALLPGYLDLKAIGYGCTSGSTIIGETRISELIQSHHPSMPTSNPLTAANAALKELGTKRLGLVTPYRSDVTELMQARFEEAGIVVQSVGSFYQEDDRVVGRITPDAILNAALAVGQNDLVDGVFISCTSLRAAGIIEQAEAALGKPVTASNHALAWHLLRLAAIRDQVAGFGRLFHTQLPNQEN
jgi:maleate isomerase